MPDLLSIPTYSDLGGVSSPQQNTWDGEAALRQEYHKYYTGLVFSEKVPSEIANKDTPLMYPVGLNLVKMLCDTMSESLWGEWEEDLVRFKIRQDLQEDRPAADAIKLMQMVLRTNNFSSLGYQLSLDREIYGGCAFKVGSDIGIPGYIRLSRIDLNGFYPIWDPEDPNRLLVAYVRILMTKEQAKERYGYDGDKDLVERVERWTPRAYENKLDGKVMSGFSGLNPWGIVPIIYVPRSRSESWWGDALTKDVMRIQDEINARIADLGEGLNYNSHPTRWGKNLGKAFDQRSFEIAPDAMWDLGKIIGNASPASEPEVGFLEAQNPIPEKAFAYIKFLYDWGRTSVASPPIAFGEDTGGGQRSGSTLLIRMWPLLRTIRRSRAYMSAGFAQTMEIIGRMYMQKRIDGTILAAGRLRDGTLVPDYWPLMPQDQSAIVDRVTKLLATPVPTVSLPTALSMLNLGPSEYERIKEMLADPEIGPLFKTAAKGGAETNTSASMSDED